MDAMSASSSQGSFALLSAAAGGAKYKGERGPTWQKFKLVIQTNYFSRHAEQLGKNKDLGCTTGITMLQSGMESTEHQCYRVTKKLLDYNQQNLLLAERGMLGPEEFTAEELELVRSSHAAGVDAAAVLTHAADEWRKVHAAFSTAGLVVPTSQIQGVLDEHISCYDWQLVSQGVVQRPAAAGAALMAAVTMQQPPADLTGAALTAFN